MDPGPVLMTPEEVVPSLDLGRLSFQKEILSKFIYLNIGLI